MTRGVSSLIRWLGYDTEDSVGCALQAADEAPRIRVELDHDGEGDVGDLGAPS